MKKVIILMMVLIMVVLSGCSRIFTILGKNETTRPTINSQKNVTTETRSEESATESAKETAPSETTNATTMHASDIIVAICGKSVSEANEIVGFEAELSEPGQSTTRFQWEIEPGVVINMARDIEKDIVNTARITAPEEYFYNSSIKFPDSVMPLEAADQLYYSDVVKFCGGVDGMVIEVMRDKDKVVPRGYCWANKEYYLRVLVTPDGEVTTLAGW